MLAPRNVLVVVSTASLAVFLHGCGGGGGGATTVTTTTTTTTMPPRTKPLTAQQAADYLNKLYTGFDESDVQSDLGVTISMAANTTSFFGNQYCSRFYNPGLHKYTGCFNGQADCRMSAALIGHKWMIDPMTKQVASFGSRKAGYVFNQTMVQNKWTKCSYIWDGATGNNLNRGCGNGGEGNSCNGSTGTSAWFNICPSTGKTCTAADKEVKLALCNIYPGGGRGVPSSHGRGAQCFFPGAALDFHGQSDYKAGVDKTRDMATQRVQYNDGTDTNGASSSLMNNEVVLDEELLIPDYWEDPVTAIPAFVYVKSGGQIAKNIATALRDDFCQYYRCDYNGGGQIPVVMLDDTKYQETGPFGADADAEPSMVV